MAKILFSVIRLRKFRICPVIFFLTTLGLTNSLYAQNEASSPYIPSVIPPSPNASALMRFSDVPVSPYTGTADITVPIYTIQAKGITVPVSLSYHTGGVRLKDEASWVGLGWALNAGGMISRTIIGSDDFGTTNTYFTTQVPQLAGDLSWTQPPASPGGQFLNGYIFDFYCGYQINTTVGTEDFTNAFSSVSYIYDMEPDIFSYNFSGHSGKFMLTRAGNVVMQKQENIKIKYQGTGNSVVFSITDDQGNIFYFNVLETTSVSPKPAQISSWLLSKIVTQEKDSIMFTYATGGSTSSTTADVSQTIGNYCTAITGQTNTTAVIPYYVNQTLQSIDFSNGHLQFGFDASRTDLSGGYKLDSIMIYSKNASGTQTFLKQENFFYSYFNSTYQPNSEYCRLKLDSVKESSGSYKIPPYSFIYNNPDPGGGSAKHSYGVDHWGYFNGMYNTNLVPKMTLTYSPSVNEISPYPLIWYYTDGGDRQPNFAYMQDFSLQQITYPTGGKTVLAYQANDYDYTNSRAGSTDPFVFVQTRSMDPFFSIKNHGTSAGTMDLTSVYPTIPSGTAATNVTINVGFRFKNNNSSIYSSPAGQIYFSVNGYNINMDITSASCGGSICTLSKSVILNPGVYTWNAYIASGIDTINTFDGIYVDYSYQVTEQSYNQTQNNSFITPASGLRVQSIINYKDATNITSKKVYSYTYTQDKLGTGNPQQYTYGRLMSLPIYARYGITKTSAGGVCTGMFLYSSPLTSQTSGAQGNVVGYDQVTESSVDPQTGQDLGKTVYQYFNSPDSALWYGGYRMPGSFNMVNNLTGLLLSKTNYANNGGLYVKVDETDYYYHTTNRTVYLSPKFEYFQNGGGQKTCTVGSGVNTETMAWFYPSIKSERVLLDSTRKVFYQQGDPTQSLSTTVSNYYDNPVHYQVSRSQTLDSKGNTLITVMKYPQDYAVGNTIIDSLIAHNMVSKTIEKRDSLIYAGSQTGYITGAQLSLYRQLSTQSMALDKIYKLDVQSPVTNFQPFTVNLNTTSMDSRNRLMASFDQYDAYSNMQQYTTTDQNPVTIIWDYTHMYPIAQAKNAILSDVAATSFEADGFGNWSPYTGTVTTVSSSPFPPTGNNYYNITPTATLSKSGLITGNVYIISYWSRNGAYSISGGTGSSITGKTINGWTYYEHKITASSTSLTISGTGAIDEVRLYPSTALMTTYTYSPLIGMTTQCDADNKVNYYYYDGLGRLKWIKDQDGNIIKTIQYHYLGGATQF